MPHFTMNQLYCWTSSVWLILCFTVCTCRATTVNGFAGQDVTLPCKYDLRSYGLNKICWMRGDIPLRGCGAEIISTNGKEVVKRSKARYQLNGELRKADASLTILNARQNDSGKYGCRVSVPGWFNDIKIVVNLAIREATQTVVTSNTPEYVTSGTLIPNITQTPVLTTQEEPTFLSSVPARVTTTPTEPEFAEQANSSLSSVPEIVTTAAWDSEMTEALVTTVVTAAIHADTLPSEVNTTVKETTDDVLPGILVPVILLLLVLGIAAVYLMRKQKRRFRTMLEIGKKSPTSVNYSNLDSSVCMPMWSTSNH